MGFVERLRQEQAAKTLQVEQQRMHQEAEKSARLQKEADESEWHIRRRGQARTFRKESGISEEVAKLGGFLVATTELDIPSTNLPIVQKDHDSVFDIVTWDERPGAGSRVSVKYIAVESCPEGIIVFHGGWLGSTTIQLKDWRGKEKQEIFDKSLEKSYRHPGIYKYTVGHTGSMWGAGNG